MAHQSLSLNSPLPLQISQVASEYRLAADRLMLAKYLDRCIGKRAIEHAWGERRTKITGANRIDSSANEF